jgi:hypothetical protein
MSTEEEASPLPMACLLLCQIYGFILSIPLEVRFQAMDANFKEPNLTPDHGRQVPTNLRSAFPEL